MAPHQALVVPDILHEIFQHLSPCPQLYLPDDDLGDFVFSTVLYQPQREVCEANRLTLARAARTCKAFQDPASTVLWELLDELGPILLVVRGAENRTSGGSQLDTVDWVRFEHIAKRIRALSCHAYDDDLDLFSLFCSHYAPTHPILPNLRALLIPIEQVSKEAGSRRLLDVMRRLCTSPSLILVSLDVLTVSNEHDVQLLDIIAECCPGLLHFQSPNIFWFHQQGRRALGRLTSLRTAMFGRIYEPTMRVLGSLPELRALRGNFTMFRHSEMGNKEPRNAFRTLQKLNTSVQMSNPHGDFFSGTVLPLVLFTSLIVLDLSVLHASPQKIPEYLEEICSSTALPQLRHLHVSIQLTSLSTRDLSTGSPNAQPTFFQIRFADVLAHLMRLPALTDISISAGCLVPEGPAVVALFDICDSDLDTIAATWPDLARLKLSCSDRVGRCRGPCMPSLSAVVALAECCHKLESVDVEFADVGADELVQFEARARSACSLDLESFQSRRPRAQLRQIAIASARQRQCGTGYWVEDRYHKRLSVAEPLRLAAALRRLFPILRSGLGEPDLAEEMEGSQDTRNDDMGLEIGAMRLLKALDDL